MSRGWPDPGIRKLYSPEGTSWAPLASMAERAGEPRSNGARDRETKPRVEWELGCLVLC